MLNVAGEGLEFIVGKVKYFDFLCVYCFILHSPNLTLTKI
ncbi:MAG: hypothetical protein JWP37_794 [Mucilaginibacter sp.]|nr:hypothetical protein [Mucilaginibacter sp.]